MSLLAAWVALPLLLVAVTVGCGLLVERLIGVRIPGPLLGGTGLAVVVTAGQLATSSSATAELAAPLVAALALAGFGLAGRARLRPPDPWAIGASTAVFAVYAAPIVASGEATFAGYLRLDDTATWLALTDRIAEHGRSLEGLAPSTYEATLAFNLGEGYPIGGLVPLVVGHVAIGEDVAWLIQPYMALLAAVLALAIWSLAEPLVADRRLRAAVAFVAAQPALLFGYYLWGGVKEIAAAALIATAAALLAVAIRERFAAPALVPVAIASAALVGVLSPAGAIWLIPVLAVLGALGAIALGLAPLARRAAGPLALGCALSLPALVAGVLPPTSSSLTDAEARGNLFDPLDPAQAAGIWPAGDFRLAPDERLVTAVLIGLAVVAGLAGVAFAWRRRAWPLLAFTAAALLAGLVMVAVGSPWVAAKALATASPAIPLLALAGAAALLLDGRRLIGAGLAIAVAGGVIWSNALAYRDVNLAPREQLAELEEIGEAIAGRGPTLITEYQPYGARHFLRDADPEAASELRRRTVPLRHGGTLRKGEWADTDDLELDALLVYRTLVLRRNPAQSRPPSAYELVRAGREYDVWERRAGSPGEILARLPLGGSVDPAGRPDCARVRALAERAGEAGTLVAAGAASVVTAELAPGVGTPRAGGSIRRAVRVPVSADYAIWVGGSVRPRVEVWVDGRRVDAVRHELNNAGQYVRLGAARLERGRHRIEVRFANADLHPGSGGAPEPVGPLALTEQRSAADRLVQVEPAGAAGLCGRSWDWIEAVR